MKTVLLITSIVVSSLFPHLLLAQKFYISDIDEPIYNSLKNRISYLGYSVVEDKKDADFITELVYEKKKGYMSFKGGYNKVGFIRFTTNNGAEVAKTGEQGGKSWGYNNYTALSSLFKKIMKTDFDSTLKLAASKYTPTLAKNPVVTSTADELAKLKKLFDDGVLTKEEYEQQKKKLLGN